VAIAVTVVVAELGESTVTFDGATADAATATTADAADAAGATETVRVTVGATAGTRDIGASASAARLGRLQSDEPFAEAAEDAGADAALTPEDLTLLTGFDLTVSLAVAFDLSAEPDWVELAGRSHGTRAKRASMAAARRFLPRPRVTDIPSLSALYATSCLASGHSIVAGLGTSTTLWA
jgi:hypothetical protein